MPKKNAYSNTDLYEMLINESFPKGLSKSSAFKLFTEQMGSNLKTDLFSKIEKDEKELLLIEKNLMNKLGDYPFNRTLYRYKFTWERKEIDVDLEEDMVDDLRRKYSKTKYLEELQHLHENYLKAQSKIDRIISRIENLQNLAFTLLSNENNEATKFLSIVATVLLPITAISGIFGMNFVNIPGGDDPKGFMIAVIVMLIVAFGSVAYFRWRKWM